MKSLGKILFCFLLIQGLTSNAQPWEKVMNGCISGGNFNLGNVFHKKYGGAVALTYCCAQNFKQTFISYNNQGDTIFRKQISFDSLGGFPLPMIPTIDLKIDEYGNRLAYGYMVINNTAYREFVLKYDSLGNLLSNRYTQNYNNLYFFSTLCSKNNYEYDFYSTDQFVGLLPGSYPQMQLQLHQLHTFIIKRDQSGNSVWQIQTTDLDTTNLQGSYSQKVTYNYIPVETSDGMFTFAKTGPISTQLQKIDANGIIQYNVPLGNYVQNYINGPVHVEISFATRDTCTNYVGYRSIPSNTIMQETFLLKIDKNGNLRDSLFFGAVNIYSGIETSIGDIILSYNSNSDGLIVLDKNFTLKQTIPSSALSNFNWNISTNSTGGCNIGAFINNPSIFKISNYDSLFNTYPNILTGYTYEDNNEDCTFNSGDNTLSQKTLVCTDQQGKNYYGFSNSTGKYSVRVPDGTYTVSQNPGLYRSVICPVANLNFIFNSTNDSINQNYFDTIISNVNDLKITLVSDPFWIGNSNALTIYYENIGTITTSATIQVIKDSALVYSNSIPAANTISGDTSVYTIANVPSGGSGYLTIYFSPSQTISSGNQITFHASIYNGLQDANLIDNTDSILNLYYGLLKIASPGPTVSTSNNINVNKPVDIYANDELAYKIRFQNTTGKSVKDVTIVNILDKNIDLSSFKLLSTSHPGSIVKLNNDGKLIIIFKDINLNDSAANEQMSKGYIVYTVKPKRTWPANQYIYNQADIFFDYLNVVTTNKTKNKSNALFLGINEMKGKSATNFKVFPNPSHGRLNILCSNLGDPKSVKLYNLIGELLVSQKIEPVSESISIWTENLIRGVYVLQLETESGLYSKKIFIEDN